MDNLLFTTLTLATLYYFFYYLPHQEKANQPINISRSVQTESIKPDNLEQEKSLENTLDELIKQIKQLNLQLK